MRKGWVPLVLPLWAAGSPCVAGPRQLRSDFGRAAQSMFQPPPIMGEASPAKAGPEDIEALPYEPKVKEFLRLFSAAGDPDDARRAFDTISLCAPDVSLRPDETNFGTSDCPMAGGKGCYVVLSPGPGPDASGAPRPDYPEEAVAGSFLHELRHVDRACRGGGANRFTDERDAWDVQYRFYTRWQQKHAGRIRLDETRAKRLADWQLAPDRFYADIVKNYIALGRIREGMVTIEEQRRALREMAAAYPGLARQAENELAKLDVDEALSRDAFELNRAWRARQESALEAYLRERPSEAADCGAVPWSCIPRLDLEGTDQP